jgi:hypothetical protein
MAPMSLSTFLKAFANMLMAARVAKLLAGDLAAEARSDAAIFQSRTSALLARSPYVAAGAATALGFLVGQQIAKRRAR